MEIRPFLALGEVEDPVKHQLNEGKKNVSCDHPDESCMDESMGGQAIAPHKGRGPLPAHIDRQMAVLSPGQKISLQRKVRKSVANDQSKKDYKSPTLTPDQGICQNSVR